MQTNQGGRILFNLRIFFDHLNNQFGDLSDDSNIVQIVREVLERRDQLDQQDNL